MSDDAERVLAAARNDWDFHFRPDADGTERWHALKTHSVLGTLSEVLDALEEIDA